MEKKYKVASHLPLSFPSVWLCSLLGKTHSGKKLMANTWHNISIVHTMGIKYMFNVSEICQMFPKIRQNDDLQWKNVTHTRERLERWWHIDGNSMHVGSNGYELRLWGRFTYSYICRSTSVLFPAMNKEDMRTMWTAVYLLVRHFLPINKKMNLANEHEKAKRNMWWGK